MSVIVLTTLDNLQQISYVLLYMTLYLSCIVQHSDPVIKLISKYSHNFTEAQLTAKSQHCTRNFFEEFTSMTLLTLQIR